MTTVSAKTGERSRKKTILSETHIKVEKKKQNC